MGGGGNKLDSRFGWMPIIEAGRCAWGGEEGYGGGGAAQDGVPLWQGAHHPAGLPSPPLLPSICHHT